MLRLLLGILLFIHVRIAHGDLGVKFVRNGDPRMKVRPRWYQSKRRSEWRMQTVIYP